MGREIFFVWELNIWFWRMLRKKGDVERICLWVVKMCCFWLMMRVIMVEMGELLGLYYVSILKWVCKIFSDLFKVWVRCIGIGNGVCMMMVGLRFRLLFGNIGFFVEWWSWFFRLMIFIEVFVLYMLNRFVVGGKYDVWYFFFCLIFFVFEYFFWMLCGMVWWWWRW